MLVKSLYIDVMYKILGVCLIFFMIFVLLMFVGCDVGSGIGGLVFSLVDLV